MFVLQSADFQRLLRRDGDSNPGYPFGVYTLSLIHIFWQASRLSLSKIYEKAPEILKVQGSVIGTLGNFSASIGLSLIHIFIMLLEKVKDGIVVFAMP